MPRNMSFALTSDQIKSRTKHVTRRLGWKSLEPGTVLNAVNKTMGLRRGEMIKFCQIRVTDVRREKLDRMLESPEYGREEVIAEGFPDMTPFDFVEMFSENMKCDPKEQVTRIAFEYLEGGVEVA